MLLLADVVHVVLGLDLLQVVPEVAADAGVVEDERLEMMMARVESNSALGPDKFILLLLSVDERPACGRT